MTLSYKKDERQKSAKVGNVARDQIDSPAARDNIQPSLEFVKKEVGKKRSRYRLPQLEKMPALKEEKYLSES
jgi:hypothetical protein